MFGFMQYMMVYMYMNTCVGCSEYTIIPARYAYLLSSDITDSQAAVLERKNYMLWQYITCCTIIYASM